MKNYNFWLCLGIGLILVGGSARLIKNISYGFKQEELKIKALNSEIEFWKNECISWKMALSECDESNKQLRNEIQKYIQ